MSAIILRGEFNIAFVHVPKTGGVSIATWLEQHKRGAAMEEFEPHPTFSEMNADGLFSFGVVRNPWDRMVSAYHYILRENSRLGLVPDEPMGFDEFVMSLTDLPKLGGHDFKVTDNQHRWLDGVDLVMRFETLQQDFKSVALMFGSTDELAILNTTDHRHYSLYYNDETRRTIARIFEQDIDQYKYLFNSL